MYNDFYVYGLYYPNTDIIFYVGKGRKARIDVSARLLKRPKDKNYFKQNALKLIYQEGNSPLKKKIKENLTESEALIIEENLIKQYGRICDGTGILTNIARSSSHGNTGWCPSNETRELWKKQRKGISQSREHINERVEKIIGKKRSNKQKYSMIVSKLKKSSDLKNKYRAILDLFHQGNFIESIHIITNIDKEVISHIIKYNQLYKAAIEEKEFDEKYYIQNLKWSCQKISHILKNKNFYKLILPLIEKKSISELCIMLNTNATRVRFIIKNRIDIEEITETYV